MKKIVKIFSILLAVFLLANCSEDIYLHDGENGKDGAQGPKGDKGDPGQVELSFVPIPASLDECPNGGYKTEVYVNDVLNNTLPATCNGKNFDIADLQLRTDLLYLDSLCKIRVMYNKGKEFFRDTVCNGGSPEAYAPEFTDTTIYLGEFVRIHKIFVDEKLVLLDTTRDGRIVIINNPGQTTEYNVFTFSESCDKYSSYGYQNVDGYNLFNTQGSINYNGSPEINTNGYTNAHNGTLVLDNLESEDTIWFSKFVQPAGISYLACDMGAKEYGWSVIYLAKDIYGKAHIIDSVSIIPVPNFIWYEGSTYKQRYILDIKSKDISNWNIVQFGLRFVGADDSFTTPTDRNDAPNLDNFICIYVGKK